MNSVQLSCIYLISFTCCRFLLWTFFDCIQYIVFFHCLLSSHCKNIFSCWTIKVWFGMNTLGVYTVYVISYVFYLCNSYQFNHPTSTAIKLSCPLIFTSVPSGLLQDIIALPRAAWVNMCQYDINPESRQKITVLFL